MDEQTLMQQLMAIILPTAITAVSIIMSWLLFELRKWVKKRTDSQALDDSLSVLGQVIQNTIANINETVKEAAQDGVVSKEEAVQLKSMAIDRIQQQIPQATKKILDTGISNLDEFISGQIESQLIITKRMKTEAGMMEPRTPVQ